MVLFARSFIMDGAAPFSPSRNNKRSAVVRATLSERASRVASQNEVKWASRRRVPWQRSVIDHVSRRCHQVSHETPEAARQHFHFDARASLW